MKFFKWLGKSREKVDIGKIVHTVNFGSFTSETGGTGGLVKLEPSPTTFYPPIEGGKDEN